LVRTLVTGLPGPTVTGTEGWFQQLQVIAAESCCGPVWKPLMVRLPCCAMAAQLMPARKALDNSTSTILRLDDDLPRCDVLDLVEKLLHVAQLARVGANGDDSGTER